MAVERCTSVWMKVLLCSVRWTAFQRLRYLGDYGISLLATSRFVLPPVSTRVTEYTIYRGSGILGHFVPGAMSLIN